MVPACLLGRLTYVKAMLNIHPSIHPWFNKGSLALLHVNVKHFKSASVLITSWVITGCFCGLPLVFRLLNLSYFCHVTSLNLTSNLHKIYCQKAWQQIWTYDHSLSWSTLCNYKLQIYCLNKLRLGRICSTDFLIKFVLRYRLAFTFCWCQCH